MAILSKKQQELLTILGEESAIYDNFYLTGGTALAEFYLQHRLSEDLDFFSEELFEPESILITLRKIQNKVGFEKIQYEQSFNRNLYFLIFSDETIKTEFTYFPFPRIQVKKKIGALFIDSLQDIAVNKVFTIYQKPRVRDFIDLYLIMQQESWSLEVLVKLAQAKFDHHIDPIQLGAKLTSVEEYKDFPHMVTQLDARIWQTFFLDEAKKLAQGFFI